MFRSATAPGSPLAEQLLRLITGMACDVPPRVAEPDSYLGRTIEFDLDPS